jgi:ubiquinone/menaquinone biosynthesis C-methylase UbiE
MISRPRRFAHEEGDYDAQYGSQPADFSPGRGAAAVLRRFGVVDGVGLEVGCGTGLMSLGLADSFAGELLLTDPSPAFLNITRRKLTQAGVNLDRVRFGVLMGEELDRLPPSSLDFIALRSTLHHVLDVPRFFLQASDALRPGGVFVCEEPCTEGYILMGAVAQFLPALCAAEGFPLTDDDRAKIENFTATIAFYVNRRVDKSKAEDKHLFRVDEVMEFGRRAGMDVHFIPNKALEELARDGVGAKETKPEFFSMFLKNYLRYCMSFGPELMDRVEKNLGRYASYLDGLAAAGNCPYMHGVFAAKKTGASARSSVLGFVRRTTRRLLRAG